MVKNKFECLYGIKVFLTTLFFKMLVIRGECYEDIKILVKIVFFMSYFLLTFDLNNCVAWNMQIKRFQLFFFRAHRILGDAQRYVPQNCGPEEVKEDHLKMQEHGKL